MKYLLLAAWFTLILCGSAHAVEPCGKIMFEGKGAGEVLFDGTVHSKKFTCDHCHESSGLTPALFEMKRGASWITMKKMERGRSCGYCHEIVYHDSFSCSVCHHK